jgi:hypothetical protein
MLCNSSAQRSYFCKGLESFLSRLENLEKPDRENAAGKAEASTGSLLEDSRIRGEKISRLGFRARNQFPQGYEALLTGKFVSVQVKLH